MQCTVIVWPIQQQYGGGLFRGVNGVYSLGLGQVASIERVAVYLLQFCHHTWKLQVLFFHASLIPAVFEERFRSLNKNLKVMLMSTSHRKIPQLRLLDLTSSNSILSCLLILLCIFSMCLAQNETVTTTAEPIERVKEYCTRERMSIEIPYEDCNSTTIKIPLCKGMCGSQTKIKASPPYAQQICQCCTSSSHRVRIRRLWFDCKGQQVLNKVYLPITEKCSCIGCGTTLGR